MKIAYGKSKSQVLVYAVSAQTSLPDVLRWSDAYLSLDSFVLTLGESLTGPVTVNLAHIPTSYWAAPQAAERVCC